MIGCFEVVLLAPAPAITSVRPAKEFSFLFVCFFQHEQEVSARLALFACLFAFAFRQFFLKQGTIYQPLRSGRIWHKVNF